MLVTSRENAVDWVSGLLPEDPEKKIVSLPSTLKAERTPHRK